MPANKPSPPSPSSPDPAFVARHAQALDKIALFADLSEGFTVGIVEVALEHDRDRAIQALLARADAAQIQWVTLHLDQPDLRYLLDAITTALQDIALVPGKKPVLLLTGLERAIGGYGDYPPLLSNFNFARDTYARKLPHPVLFWLPSYAITRFAQFAPDVWAWKSMEVRLLSDLPPPDHALATLMPIAETQRILPVAPERVDLLHRLLQEYRTPSPSRADLLNQLGQAYKSHLDYPRAAQAYQEALSLYQTLANDLGEAEAGNNLAELYWTMGRYDDAEPLHARSLAIKEQQLGADHPDTAESLNNLAGLYYAIGRYGEAEPLFARSLAIWEQQLGADHPHTASSLNNLAELYRAMGRYGEAEPLYARSLAIREQQLGADHPDTATSLNNLAGLYRAMGRTSEAEPLLARSLAIREQQLGADHPSTATSLNNLAALYRAMGRYGEAEPLFARCLEIALPALGQDHPNTQTFLNNFITCLQDAVAQGVVLSDHPLTQAMLAQLATDED